MGRCFRRSYWTCYEFYPFLIFMNCIICGRENPTVWDIMGKKYVYCPGCGFIQLSARQFPNREMERNRYLSHHNSTENSGYLTYLQKFLASSFYPFVPSGSSILDFGSGPEPVLADLLKAKGFSVDTYDPFFAPSCQWEKQKYDAVTAVEVFEHIRNPSCEIKKLSGVLNQNGSIIVRTMLHAENKMSFTSWWYRQDSTHISFFAKRTMKLLAEQNGLVIFSFKNNCEIVLSKLPHNNDLTS